MTSAFTEIPLTQGQVALVDIEDAERVIAHTWSANNQYGRYYAVSQIDGIYVYLHRLILNAPSMMEVDHIDGNGLDNRKVNLRLATHAQNLMNQPKFSGVYTSMYKGVTWNKATNKWRAQIRANDKNRYLGTFQSEEEAALAYDNAAREVFGEFANTNF